MSGLREYLVMGFLVLILSFQVVAAQDTPPGNGADMNNQGNSTSVNTSGAFVVDGTTVTTNSSNKSFIDSLFSSIMALFKIKEENFNVTIKEKDFNSSQADQSVILVNGSGSLSIDQSTISKLAGATTSDDNSNFYGVNAAVLVENGRLKIANSKIKTTVNGANGIFSNGNNSHITVENVEILTTADSSRGLDSTYGGTITGKNIKINTSGAHCAALATDRGGGIVSVVNAILNTAGEGSPGIYSTGNISANDSTVIATGSEAASIEGKNTITLINCNITGSKKYGVFIYQSTSGDAAVGEGIFNMTGGAVTAKEGPLFYSTNTVATINLEDVKLSGTGTLLKASTDSWGNSGSNGANVTLNAINQELSGTVAADSISSILLNLKDKSKLISTINSNKSAKSVTLKLSKDSSWNVTGDSYLTALTDEDTTLANIYSNGFTIYYDKSNSANNWLDGKTVNLNGGGKLTPVS